MLSSRSSCRFCNLNGVRQGTKKIESPCQTVQLIVSESNQMLNGAASKSSGEQQSFRLEFLSGIRGQDDSALTLPAEGATVNVLLSASFWAHHYHSTQKLQQLGAVNISQQQGGGLGFRRWTYSGSSSFSSSRMLGSLLRTNSRTVTGGAQMVFRMCFFLCVLEAFNVLYLHSKLISSYIQLLLKLKQIQPIQ